jgi:hypothetical protein
MSLVMCSAVVGRGSTQSWQVSSGIGRVGPLMITAPTRTAAESKTGADDPTLSPHARPRWWQNRPSGFQRHVEIGDSVLGVKESLIRQFAEQPAGTQTPVEECRHRPAHCVPVR